MGPQDTGAAYSSAIAMEFGGQRKYVQFLARTVAGVSATDGKLLWRYDKPANSMRLNISTPIYKDGYVFAASAYGAGGGLARLVQNPDGGFAAGENHESAGGREGRASRRDGATIHLSMAPSGVPAHQPSQPSSGFSISTIFGTSVKGSPCFSYSRVNQP